MKKLSGFAVALGMMLMLLFVGGCEPTQEEKDSKMVQEQQAQYAASQPVPVYNWSLERHLLTQLYNSRNMAAVTHSVWRSDLGTIEGDCPSIGFGLPYDTSLTNPLQGSYYRNGGTIVVEQAEPNGIFASKNTAATWVMCANSMGTIDPVYVETKVTSYPYPVNVNYDKNRVIKAGESTVTLNVK